MIVGVGEGNIRSRGQGRLLRGGVAELRPGCWEEAGPRKTRRALLGAVTTSVSLKVPETRL